MDEALLAKSDHIFELGKQETEVRSDHLKRQRDF
jgi:hypothetical protein